VNARRLCLILVVLLALSFFWGWVRRAPAGAQGQRLVLAFYYAWYDTTTWQKPLPDQPAQSYVSTNPAAIERHVLWARQAGIDGFVQSWYGPQVENNQTETNFAALLDVAAQHGFAAAVDLEVTSPFFHSEADIVAALQHLLTVHASHPAYLRVGGRPVVFFWRQDRYPVQSWQAIRDQVDPQRASVWIAEGVSLNYLGPFDGNHLYSVAWDPEPEGTLRRWGGRVRDWNVEHGTARYWVATVMPGYDDLVTGRADSFVRDRTGGVYYRRCWDGAIQSEADWVIITSFNEWMEGTQIEPSVGYGEFYLDLTRELAGLYRAGGPPLQEGEPTAVLSPTDTPPPSPTPTPAVTPALQAELQGAATMVSPIPTPTLAPPPTSPPAVTPTLSPVPTPTPTATSSHTATLAPTPIPLPAGHGDTLGTESQAKAPTLPQRVIAAARPYPGLVAAGLALLLVLVVLLRSRTR